MTVTVAPACRCASLKAMKCMRGATHSSFHRGSSDRVTVAAAVTAGSVQRIRCLGAEPLRCCQGGGGLQLFYPLRRRRGGAGGGGSGSRVRGGGGGGGYAVMDLGSPASPRGGAVACRAGCAIGTWGVSPPSSTLGAGWAGGEPRRAGRPGRPGRALGGAWGGEGRGDGGPAPARGCACPA